jgi:integrase
MPNAVFVGRVPKYRRHKPSGQAAVSLCGKDFYLGLHGTRASKAEYDRLIGEWLAAGRTLPHPQADLTVAELALRYLRFAQGYYRRDGEPTRSLERVQTALKALRKSYAHTLVSDFGPLALQALQHKLAASELSRRYVNYLVDTIRRMFKWGVAQEVVPETVYPALTAVSGLRAGRTPARETEPIGPVDEAVVEATLPYLPPIVADMVRFQQASGCRPGEVCAVRPCDVDTSGSAWIYTPRRHKTDYRGHTRVIFVGPKGQDALRRYLLRPAEAFCFCPAEGERKRRADLHQERVTPLSCGNRPGSNRRRRPKKHPGERYTSRSYHAAVRHAVIKANEEREKKGIEERVPAWHPNQLRHSAATAIRKYFGLEAVQAVLGHKSLAVSEVYAKKNLALAAEVMRKIG